MNNMNDYSSQIIEDIKWILFNDRNYETSFEFEKWIGDGHSLIIKDSDAQKYRITITKE